MSDELLQNATLPERMRAAADTLIEANKRYREERPWTSGTPEVVSWNAANLRLVANRWEEQDAAATTERQLVDDLASALFNAGWHQVTTDQVRQLINDGWTKQGTDG